MRRPLRATALVAAALSVALIAPVSSTASADAPRRGVDTAPPAEGSCHDLTYAEGLNAADPDPAVDCTEAHTSVTLAVVKFAKAPDWSDVGALYRRSQEKCVRGEILVFGAEPKALQSSAYSEWLFVPSKAQRDAGAKWVRCDIALAEGKTLQPLPTDGPPQLGPLPLDDSLARCRAGKPLGFLVVACSGPHTQGAAPLIKRPGGTYPGTKRMHAWTYQRCHAKLGRSLGVYEWPTKPMWRHGLRFSTCFRKTRS
ncbi:hypothetical protein [Nocardioides panacisoli]|uniref:Septum formation-related domain-containing protein n=1 Tax=Nocardioides panacisoli TaxID=627624 RepID=A0ABP7IVD4_9ACTN